MILPKKKQYTITEAAKELGVTRAAVHCAIKQGRLEADWAETTQIMGKNAWLIDTSNLAQYRVDLSRQERGKKLPLA